MVGFELPHTSWVESIPLRNPCASRTNADNCTVPCNTVVTGLGESSSATIAPGGPTATTDVSALPSTLATILVIPFATPRTSAERKEYGVTVATAGLVPDRVT